MISYQIVRFWSFTCCVSLEPLVYHRNLTSLSLFYSYYLVNVNLKWLNWFLFFIPLTVLLVILIACMIIMLHFLNVIRISLSTVSLFAQLDSGISLLAVSFLLTYDVNRFKSRVNRQGSLYSFFYDFYLIFILFFWGSKKMQTYASR